MATSVFNESLFATKHFFLRFLFFTYLIIFSFFYKNFIKDEHKYYNSKPCFKTNWKINSRMLKERYKIYGRVYKQVPKYTLKKTNIYNLLFIDYWKKKSDRKKYKVKKLSPCSIFSLFNNNSSKNNNKKKKKNSDKKYQNSENNQNNQNRQESEKSEKNEKTRKNEKNMGMESKQKETVLLENDLKNGNDKTEKEQKTEKEKLQGESGNKKKQLSGSNMGNKTEGPNKEVESSKHKMKKNIIPGNTEISNDKVNSEKDFERNEGNANRIKETEMIRFYDINNSSTSKKKMLKNINEYENHLEVLKEKTIIAINMIFCNYTKNLNSNGNFKSFFEKVIFTFEEKFQQHSLITDIAQIQNNKMKNEYILKNVTCFKELIDILEQHFFNTLLLKIHLLKMKAMNEIQNYIVGTEGTYKEGRNISITEYSEKINQVVKKYIRDIQKLMPSDYEFSLYKEIKKEDIFVTDFSFSFPTNKYKKLIQQHIKDFKQFAQDITKNNKLKILREIENNKNYQNILQIIDNQQKQMDLLQEQLDTSVEAAQGRYSPLHCAISYRVPDTNLNVSTQYAKGKFNVKINCIPDDSMHLLGSYGFVKSLPFGNLGLSLSFNF